jgi:hypothetical protein
MTKTGAQFTGVFQAGTDPARKQVGKQVCDIDDLILKSWGLMLLVHIL